MPTARPSIVARIGAVEPRSTKPVAIVMPETPMPTPMSAVTSGMPAASSDPNVMTSTKIATMMPSASVAAGVGDLLERVTADLDAAARRHARRPAHARGCRCRPWSARRTAWRRTPSRCRCGRPRRPGRRRKGPTTEATCVRRDLRQRAVDVGLLLAPSVWPSGAWKTIRAVAPSGAACGDRSLIRSNALTDSMPGSAELVGGLARQRGAADRRRGPAGRASTPAT